MSRQTSSHHDGLSSHMPVRSERLAGDMRALPLVLRRMGLVCSRMSATWYGIAALHAGTGLAGVLVGRAQVLNLLAPFGLAYMFAVLYWRRSLAVSALIGVSAGQALLGGWESALQQALLLAVFWLMAELTGGVSGESRPETAPERLLPAAGGTAAVIRGFVWFGTGTTLYYLCLFAFELVIMLCSCIVFCRGLGVILGSPTQRQPAGSRDNYVQELTAACLAVTIFAAVAFMGMSGWEISGQRALWVFALLTIMLAAALAGMWGGLAAGMAMGAVLGIAVQLDLGLAVSLAVGGLLAGLVMRRSRFWVPVALVLPALALYSLFSTRPGWVFSPWEMLFAVGIYALACTRIGHSRPVYLSNPVAVQTAAADATVGLQPSAGQDYSSSGRRPDESAADEDDGPGQLLGRLLRGSIGSSETGAAERMKAFARVFRRLADSFSEVEKGEPVMPSASDMVARVVEGVGFEVCRECRRYQDCWQQKFMGTYREISRILLRLDISSPPIYSDVESEMRRFCSVHPRRLYQVMKTAYRAEQIKHGWSARFAETRDLAATQLRGLAQIMDDLASGMNRQDNAHNHQKKRQPRLRYEVGIADLAHGKGPSGDTHLVRKLNGDQLVVMLSDGMGRGDRAAQESRAAVSLLEELLGLGLDRESALRTVNSVLVLRSTEDIFATVDMMSVDLSCGEAEFTKIGAAPTFVKRGREVLSISSGVVPIGILSEVSLDSATRRLRADDTVIMMTDGILAALGSLTETQKKTWLSRFLAGSSHDSAEDLATALVAQAVSFCPDGPPDDMTVVAVRLQSR